MRYSTHCFSFLTLVCLSCEAAPSGNNSTTYSADTLVPQLSLSLEYNTKSRECWAVLRRVVAQCGDAAHRATAGKAAVDYATLLRNTAVATQNENIPWFVQRKAGTDVTLAMISNSDAIVRDGSIATSKLSNYIFGIGWSDPTDVGTFALAETRVVAGALYPSDHPQGNLIYAIAMRALTSETCTKEHEDINLAALNETSKWWRLSSTLAVIANGYDRGLHSAANGNMCAEPRYRNNPTGLICVAVPDEVNPAK